MWIVLSGHITAQTSHRLSVMAGMRVWGKRTKVPKECIHHVDSTCEYMV